MCVTYIPTDAMVCVPMCGRRLRDGAAEDGQTYSHLQGDDGNMMYICELVDVRATYLCIDWSCTHII